MSHQMKREQQYPLPTDQEIADAMARSKRTGISPWWKRRHEYLENAGRRVQILEERLDEIDLIARALFPRKRARAAA